MGRWDFETFKNLKQNRKNFENAFRQNEKFYSRQKIVGCWGRFLKIIDIYHITYAYHKSHKSYIA